ncbi:hypothetical protein Ccrd_007247, partial [Cynara cardunculus var. scolymus]
MKSINNRSRFPYALTVGGNCNQKGEKDDDVKLNSSEFIFRYKNHGMVNLMAETSGTLLKKINRSDGASTQILSHGRRGYTWFVMKETDLKPWVFVKISRGERRPQKSVISLRERERDIFFVAEVAYQRWGGSWPAGKCRPT